MELGLALLDQNMCRFVTALSLFPTITFIQSSHSVTVKLYVNFYWFEIGSHYACGSTSPFLAIELKRCANHNKLFTTRQTDYLLRRVKWLAPVNQLLGDIWKLISGISLILNIFVRCPNGGRRNCFLASRSSETAFASHV